MVCENSFIVLVFKYVCYLLNPDSYSLFTRLYPASRFQLCDSIIIELMQLMLQYTAEKSRVATNT